MKNILQKYWAWSDKINKPFYENQHRLALYVILAQSLLVTVALFKLPQDDKIVLICKPDLHTNAIICEEM